MTRLGKRQSDCPQGSLVEKKKRRRTTDETTPLACEPYASKVKIALLVWGILEKHIMLQKQLFNTFNKYLPILNLMDSFFTYYFVILM